MHAALLASFGDPADDRLRRFSDPHDVVVATAWSDVGSALARVERGVARGWHAVGYVAYDAAPAFDRALAIPGRHAMPLLCFGLFDEPEIGELREPPRAVARWDRPADRAEHARAVARIRDAIARGDVYQVNHTARLRAPYAHDPLALFAHMHRAQPTPFAAYLDLGRYCIASASPELFFERRGTELRMKPMKGTARRGRWAADDDRRRDRLRASPKERAETLMIVDLVRNDLGRIARTGTVRVPSLLDVEQHPSVWQMTSEVTASIPPGTTLEAMLASLFPCGSVTGAPKIAAATIIADLEREPRGVYCGAIGHIRPSGDATFSVAIRTAVVDRKAGEVELGVGGGVTWDSTADAEYEELTSKAAFLTTPALEHRGFSLLETMRLEGGAIVRMGAHLARAERSARWFGRAFDRAAIEQALHRHAAAHEGAAARRVRLTIDEAGAPCVESAPLVSAPAPWTAALAAGPIDPADPFLYHKTTRRDLYARHRASAHGVNGVNGVNDVLLFNQAGDLTEFTTGNLVVDVDGVRATPPQECGLLGGILRQELLQTGAAVERTLRAPDLERADAIWFANSLRGLLRVQLVR